MTIQDFSHDDFLAEVRRRLDVGQFGWHGLVSTDQNDYHAMWTALYLFVRHKQNDDFRWREMAAEMERLVNDKPSPPKLSGVNTTLIGREDEL